LNKIFTPIFLAMLTLAPVLAALPIAPVFATGNAVVQTDQSVYAADMGTTFTVAVQVSNVANLVGYDAILTYNPTILSAQSVDFMSSATVIGPFCSASQCFPVVQSFSDATGSIEGAFTLLGGVTTSVSSPVNLYVVTFKVVGAGDSALTISSATIAAEVGGSTVSVPTTIMSGQYLLPPTLSFVAPNGQPAASHTLHLFKGETSILYNGLIQLSPSAPRSGFGGVIITVVNPTQSEVYTVTSNIAFMFPGQSVTVSGVVDFSDNPLVGTYHVTVTLLRCPLPSGCVAGATATGQSFKVKA
jgi:Cohesin domain